MQEEKRGIIKKTAHFFDKLEDHVRGRLSHHPILYSVIGGVAVVLFWRGVWMLADEIGLSSISSILVSVVILLVSGLFVSFFVGDRIILSGLRHEKKVVEKTEGELKEEMTALSGMKHELKRIEHEIEELEAKSDGDPIS